MSLSVKNPEAYRLAKKISKATGDSLTKVVIDSLRERDEKIQKQKRRVTFEEALAIAERAARTVKRPYIDHGDLLYDEFGLPK